jgi:hypothetical protein
LQIKAAFKQLNLPADRTLRQTKFLRRSGEITDARAGLENPQGVQGRQVMHGFTMSFFHKRASMFSFSPRAASG